VLSILVFLRTDDMNSFFKVKSEDMKKLIAGNWKMYGDKASSKALIRDIAAGAQRYFDKADFLVCPPYVHIDLVRGEAEGMGVAIGGQDCVPQEQGAFTGDVSAPMLKDMGCAYVILGHSERRQYHKEPSSLIAEKAKAAHQSGLKTIICVGESAVERESGQELSVIEKQLVESVPASSNESNTVIAYEPVWAIGTGLTAQAEDIASMHRFIYEKMQTMLESVANLRILYGGSVKPENAAEILGTQHVQGALIGGASLKAESFLGIAAEI